MAQPLQQAVDEFRAPGATWGAELRTYEREKRRVVDEGLVRGQQLRLPKGAVQVQERVFDPLLQRFRDGGVESQQRLMEERERVAHLNRAQDIDIIRGQPFNIINQSSKLEALAPGQDPMRLGGQPGHGTGETRRTRDVKFSHPQTFTDYNIVSNLPFDDHHWQRPGERPPCKEREGLTRKVPHWSIKDFDIITNKYVSDHDEKIQRDKRLNLLEATQKHAKQNRFDIISQQFNDPRQEERARVALDAREVEATMRADAQMPPSFKGRLSAHYGVISHEAHNPEMLQLYDTLEDERKDRHKNRYIVEHNLHVQDVKNDHITAARKLNKIAPERFEEQKRRGYDIIDNREYGRGLKEKALHEDFTTKRMSPWERAQQGKLPTDTSQASCHNQTMRPEAARAAASSMASSSSAPQLRGGSGGSGSGSGGGRPACAAGSDAASVAAASAKRSSASAALSRSVSSGALALPHAPGSGGMGGVGLPRHTPGPPPAPAIPGNSMGAVFSRPTG